RARARQSRAGDAGGLGGVRARAPRRRGALRRAAAPRVRGGPTGAHGDALRRLGAAEFHPTRMELSAGGTLTIVDGMAKKMVRGGLRTAGGGYLFLLPKDDLPTPRRP